ncbi:MAG: extracellular solute-binding protein [Oscillospiraceae bacterium]|nr:extracellular solute-binding protein [Oscillospiraceae bacterium]
MKKWISLLLCVCMTLALTSAMAMGYETDESLAGEFTWWTYFDQAPFLKDEFNKKYPNVTVHLEVFGGEDYQTKIMSTLPSGQGVPDLFDLEEGYVYKFIESPLLENLESLGVRAFTSDYYPWALAMATDKQGNIKGVCDNVSPVAFWYLRDAMAEWLGTSDDAEITAKLSDWDAILELSKDITARSNGEVHLLSNMSDLVKVEGYSLTPFVRDGVFSVEPGWVDLLDTMRSFWDAGVLADLGGWSGEWATAWNDGTLLIRVMPSWDFFTNWDQNSGNVGVAAPFKGSYEGGTYRAVYANSEKKDLCLKFIEFLTTVPYQAENLAVNNQMPANMKVLEAMGPDYSNEKFGGQNILQTYDKVCQSILDIVPDIYTRDCQNLFGKHANQGIKDGLANDQIIKNFQDEVRDKYPELKGL